MVRSGLEILSAHPKLYWRDDCRPGGEWLRLSRKKMPADRLWTGADEETSFSPLIALPGRRNLGMGRHWHFFCAIFWILNGLAYVTLLFANGEWRRLVPTSWSVVLRGGARCVDLSAPAHAAGGPSLQCAAAAHVRRRRVLDRADFDPHRRCDVTRARRAITLGTCARSAVGNPRGASISCRCSRWSASRSCTSCSSPSKISRATWTGSSARKDARETLAVWIGVAGLVVVLALHVGATIFSLRHQRTVQRWLGKVIEPMHRVLLPSRHLAPALHPRTIRRRSSASTATRPSRPNTSASRITSSSIGGSRWVVSSSPRSSSRSPICARCPRRRKSPSTIASRGGPPSESGRASRSPTCSTAAGRLRARATSCSAASTKKTVASTTRRSTSSSRVIRRRSSPTR